MPKLMHVVTAVCRYFPRSLSQSVRLGIEQSCGTCDQILLPVGMLLSEICEGRSYFTTDGRYYFLLGYYCLKFPKLLYD
jgi:hypothetical protein